MLSSAVNGGLICAIAVAARGKNRRESDRTRSETIAIAESSTGGLVAAALLAVPGASAYFRWRRGGLIRSRRASALLGIGDAEMQGLRPATEPYSLLIARRVRERHGATWGFGETGAGRAEPAIATAIRPGTPAWPSPARSSARSRCKPAALIRLANMECFPRRCARISCRGNIRQS